MKRKNGIVALSPDELLKVLRAAKQRSVRDWTMILLAYSHGLRASEVCNLRLPDVRDNVLRVSRLKGSIPTVQPLLGHRGQPLLDEQRAVREWKKVRPADAGDYLFATQKGPAMHRSQFFRVYRAAAAAAGLEKAKQHPHALKHSVATHLIAQNVNLAHVKQYLGHASVSSTMRYCEVNDQQASEAARNGLMSTF